MRLRSWFAGPFVIVVLVAACGQADENGAQRDRDGPFMIPLKDRCEASSMDEASQDAPFELIQPASALASRRNLIAIWSCPGTVFVLEYPADLTVWESLNDLSDPEEVWDRMGRTYEEFSVGEINGIPASLAAPIRDATGGVDFVVGGVRYTVSGNGDIPLSDLIVIAESMSIPAS